MSGEWSPCIMLGGFLEFQATHPSLCQSQTAYSTSTASGYKCPPLTSMSQPCLPVSNVGPTKILPFLFLGSQQDALSQETMQVSCGLLITTMMCCRADNDGDGCACGGDGKTKLALD